MSFEFDGVNMFWFVFFMGKLIYIYYVVVFYVCCFCIFDVSVMFLYNVFSVFFVVSLNIF